MHVACLAPWRQNAAVQGRELLPATGRAGPDFGWGASRLSGDCGDGRVAGERCAGNPGVTGGSIEFFAAPDRLRGLSARTHAREAGISIYVLGEGEAVGGGPRDSGRRGFAIWR